MLFTTFESETNRMIAGPRAKGDILVCGAGIAGCALAFWLQQFGFTPTIVEQAKRFRDSGYLIDVWGSGYDVLQQSGLLKKVMAHAYAMDRIKFVDKRGYEIAGYGGDIVREALHGRFFNIPRGDLARALYEALEGRVETLYGTSVNVLLDRTDAAYVTFSDNGLRRFDLVIGADGLRSHIRKLAFGSESQFEKYLGYYAASFIAVGYPHRDKNVYVSHARAGRQIARYAMRDDRSAFLFVFADAGPLLIPRLGITAQKEILRAHFGEDEWEVPEIFKCLEAADELYFDAVSQIRMPKWSRGRVALVGDAAYCPSLLSGEGAAFAMLGAFVLAGELHRANGDHAQAFAAYEMRLRAFLLRKQELASRFAIYFAPTTELGLLVRNAALKLLNIPAVGVAMTRSMFGQSFTLPDYG
jgi:2-polyprenyl-6-methoxyphenol hydroxylase-like FAD-dependent oxidoreductase